MIHLSTRKKICSTIFVVFVFLVSASACAKDDSALYASDPAVLTMNGKIVEVPYVLKIGKEKVTLDEYRYHFLNAKYNADQGDDDFWAKDTDGSQQRMLKFQTETALKDSYAIESLAKKHQLSLTNDEKGQIEADVQRQIETLGGPTEYKKALESAFLTDQLYRIVWRTSYQYEKLYSFYFGEKGEFHNTDTTVDSDAKELAYQTKLQSIIAQEADKLPVEYGPEYELIGVDTLY